VAKNHLPVWVVTEMVGYERRAFLAGISSLGVTALAGCSSDGGSSDGSGDGGNDNTKQNYEILSNEMDGSGDAQISTLTVENKTEEELNPNVSVVFDIGVDGHYGSNTDEQSVSMGGGETAEVSLELYDADALTEVAVNEIQNGYFSITYLIDGVEMSFQEFGDKPSQYVSFKVLYDGGWQGALGTESGQRSISGQGDSHLPVDNDANIVSGNAQKQGGGSGNLTVQILVDGEVISEQSTSAEYGVAQISENI